MSYTALILFREGKPPEESENYGNAWGGAARIWNALFDRYHRDADKPYDSWINPYD